MSALNKNTAAAYTGPELQDLEQWAHPPASQRTTLLMGLRDWAEAHLDILKSPQGEAYRARFLRLVMGCDDLPLMVWMGRMRQQMRELQLEESVELVSAYWRQGYHQEAWDQSRLTLLTHPKSEAAEAMHRDLLHYQRQGHGFGERFLPWDQALAHDGELFLEPLGHQHVGDFAWQYDDPAIAELCCLPRFETEEQWHQWLHTHQHYADQIMFGIQHQDWGFIGCVGLVLHQGVGFFYYWIGRDFQGLGFGPRAALKLFEIAERTWGMHVCYAKAFEDNLPSLRGLEKLGFQPLSLDISGELADEQFFRRPSAGREQVLDQAEEVRFLFDAMGSLSRVNHVICPPGVRSECNKD